MPQRPRIAEQSDKRLGKIRIVRAGPEIGPIAVNNHRLARQHSRRRRPGMRKAADRQRNVCIAVRPRRPHDHHRESIAAILRRQSRLRRDLVARILIERIVQRRRFGDQIMRRRLLIRRGGTDETILRRLPRKEPDIALHIGRGVGEERRDDIEMFPLQCRGGLRFIVNISSDQFDPLRQFPRRLSAIEDEHFHSALRRQFHAGRADDSRSADEEDFHGDIVADERRNAIFLSV